MFSKETWWREWKNNQFKTKIEIKKELISSMFRSHHSVQLECIITFDQSLSCSHISLLGITICYISILFFSAPFFFAFFLFPKHAELGLTLTILPFLFWDGAFLSGSTRDSHAGSFSSSASWVKALSSEGFPVLDFKPLVFFHTPYSTHMLYFVFVTLLLIFITWYFILDEYSLGPQIQQNASQWKEMFFVCMHISNDHMWNNYWHIGEGNGYPLQYSCLENPMDRRACQATVHGVTKSWTWPSN